MDSDALITACVMALDEYPGMSRRYVLESSISAAGGNLHRVHGYLRHLVELQKSGEAVRGPCRPKLVGTWYMYVSIGS